MAKIIKDKSWQSNFEKQSSDFGSSLGVPFLSYLITTVPKMIILF